jgi:dihydroorotate dehydrogenase
MWYRATRPALFALDPERAHRPALEAMQLVGKHRRQRRVESPVECMGLRFPNRVGLAAGFEKSSWELLIGRTGIVLRWQDHEAAVDMTG